MSTKILSQQIERNCFPLFVCHARRMDGICFAENACKPTIGRKKYISPDENKDNQILVISQAMFILTRRVFMWNALGIVVSC